MKNKQKNIPTILFISFIIVGIFVMFYPVTLSVINAEKEEKVIEEYNTKVGTVASSQYTSYFEEAEKYNSTLTNEGIIDAFTKETEVLDEEYNQLLNIGNDGVMGYIKIPKIDVNIPIYHGTSSNVLQKGVGHFESSSLPIGGESTHAILSGHRGLPSSRLFSDLNQLVVGDTFYIYILDQVFAYKIDDISVVEPTDLEKLKIIEGEDHITLVTCTPYAINTHRLLVRGTRLEFHEEELQNVKSEKKIAQADLFLYAGLFFVIIVVLSSILYVKRFSKEEKQIDNPINKIE